MVIPKDAPHPKNAMLFINFMMRPEVAGGQHQPDLLRDRQHGRDEIREQGYLDDPAIYPDPKVMANGYPSVVRDIEIQKLITREWTRFKTGQ